MSSDSPTLSDLRIDRNAVPRRNGAGWFLLIVLGLFVVGGLTYWLLFGRSQGPVVRTTLARETVTSGSRTLLNASGYVTARREATVSSKVTGKVVEVLIEEGMKVEEGRVLARLDSSNVEADLKLAQARLESARKSLDETRAGLDQAERELRRINELALGKVASVSELDRAEADVKTLRARLERQLADVTVAEREVAAWQQQFDDTIIRAPFAGVVTSKNAQPGEMISPMSAGGGFTRTGICTIVDMDSLEVEVDVNESYINRVAEGQPVEAVLDAYPNWRIPSRVIAIIPTADRQKATVKVRVGFESLDPRILPDMGVKVAFQSKDAPAETTRGVSIPKAAIRQQGGRDIVWVVKEGRVERRAVTVADTVGDRSSITAGLSDGERVVVDAPQDLADGAAVTEAKP
jgi:RND family efflux transporter MFP subunit